MVASWPAQAALPDLVQCAMNRHEKASKMQVSLASGMDVRQTGRGGYREPTELAEGGNEGRSGTEGNHRKTMDVTSAEVSGSVACQGCGG